MPIPELILASLTSLYTTVNVPISYMEEKISIQDSHFLWVERCELLRIPPPPFQWALCVKESFPLDVEWLA